jgi:hypothetical protein
MTVTDLGVVLAFLAIAGVVAKMLRAFRLLEARVTLLQEEIERSHGAARKATSQVTTRPAARTPVLGVPVVSANPPQRPASADARGTDEGRPSGEAAGNASDDEIAWAWLVQEQARLRKEMGRDFQARKATRSAAEVRGGDIRDKSAPRLLSAREVAAKLERK